ncbi:MAG: DUF655 domain-containing protein, partial [Nitrososphaerales archaeon]
GPIIQAIGEEHLTLLEIMAMNGVSFDIGEKIYIGKEGRTKVVSVLGKLPYSSLRESAKNEVSRVSESIVRSNERKFIAYFNELQAITPRLHALELIPGVGKTLMKNILRQREKNSFRSFEDLQNRVAIREPSKLIAKRIADELSRDSRINIFVKR